MREADECRRKVHLPLAMTGAVNLGGTTGIFLPSHCGREVFIFICVIALDRSPIPQAVDPGEFHEPRNDEIM